MSDELNEIHDHEDDELLDEEEEIEAYCMTCREKVPMDNPQAIWTRRGAPGTRGTCPTCGTTVFRMGKTNAHATIKRPEPVKVQESESGRGRRKIETPVTYINYGVNDAEFAEILAEDLKRIGIRTWLAGTEVEDVNWATGVHPMLVECKSMVVVLSALAIKATNVEEALQFFLERNKPIYVVLLEPVEVPDALRRKPRFDFSGDDFKQQFRQLAGAITGS